MKIIILKENLKGVLSAVERAVVENNSLPILKNILLKAEDGRVYCSATNLEMGIVKSTAGKVNENGAITIPFHTLYSIVSNSDSERISFETERAALLVKTESYKAKIQGIPAEEFPIIPKIENQNQWLEVDTTTLKDAIGEVASAAQISEIRPEIGGVLFDMQDGAVKFVATDSFRLGEKTLFPKQFSTTLRKGAKVIVPLKTIQEVIRIFPNNTPLRLFVDPNQILFKTTDTELISRLVDGTYPDYEQIIPKTKETEILTRREPFVNALKLVGGFSGKANEVKMKTDTEKKAVDIYSANQYVGENNYTIPAKIKGEPIREVSFNWRYLIDGLKSIKTEEFLITVNGDSKPAVLRAPEEHSYFYLLMPIKNS